jgi:hypothetical protein
MKNRLIGAIGVGVVLAAAQSASANPFDPSQFFTIAVSDSTGTGTFEISMADAHWDVPGERIVWQQDAAPLPIPDDRGGTAIATMVNASFAIQFAPRAMIEMNFGLLNGGPETISVAAQTPLLSFPTIVAADAAARSEVSFDLTDGPDGYAAMYSTASPVGVGAVRGRTNGAGAAGDMFSHLFYSVSVEGLPGQSAGSISTSQSFPNFGYQAVGHDISNMSMDIGYTLTPGDVLMTSTSMELTQSIPVPEPGTWLLLALGAAAALRRR